MSSVERVKKSLSDKLSRARVLKQHYFTPAECQIPSLKRQDAVHQALLVKRDRQQRRSQEDDNSNNIVLDGFYLLEATGMGFPEDVRQALISDRNLVSIVEDDMSYFTEMLYIDAAENRLQLAPFGSFPKLRDLRLACNNISYIAPELFGFEHLLSLDLSYNRLSVECIQALDALPNLRDLDISGNKLKEVPDDWQHFRVLEKLMLDYNLLENNDIFTSISSAPNLRHLSVYDNHLSSFPELSLSFDGFRTLETLDLACNYFNRESDIEPATRIPRLGTLKLYGNPIFGETGEDPLYIYIEELVDEAIAYREANAPHLPNIDFVTEFPRARNIKKGQPMGRQANYRDFSIVQVDTSAEQTNRSWRERGNQTIFAETMHQKRKVKNAGLPGLSEQPSAANLPDMTFLTGVAPVDTAPPSSSQPVRKVGSQGAQGVHGEIADDVMQRVAGDMGLISSAELLMLRDKTKVTSTLLNYLESDIDLDVGEEDYEYELHRDPNEPSQPQRATLTSAQRRQRIQQHLQQQQQDQDQVPGGLFRQQMGADNNTVQPRPVALKTAMRALQMALNQPLTNYDELPSKSAMFPSKDYYKPTSSSVLRQMPRHALPDRLAAAEAQAEQFDAQAEMERYGVVPPAPLRGRATSSVGRMVTAGAAAAAAAREEPSSGASVGGVSLALSFRTSNSQMSQSTTSSSHHLGHHNHHHGSSTHKPKSSSALRNAGQQSMQKVADIPQIPWKARLEDPDLPAKKYTHRGLKESSTVKSKRKEQRVNTLHQIDDVLQSLNAHTTGWSEQQAIQGLNSAVNRGHQAKSEKETMREMREFAQPFTGVKSLLNMVSDIEQEFFS